MNANRIWLVQSSRCGTDVCPAHILQHQMYPSQQLCRTLVPSECLWAPHDNGRRSDSSPALVCNAATRPTRSQRFSVAHRLLCAVLSLPQKSCTRAPNTTTSWIAVLCSIARPGTRTDRRTRVAAVSPDTPSSGNKKRHLRMMWRNVWFFRRLCLANASAHRCRPWLPLRRGNNG